MGLLRAIREWWNRPRIPDSFTEGCNATLREQRATRALEPAIRVAEQCVAEIVVNYGMFGDARYRCPAKATVGDYCEYHNPAKNWEPKGE